jgi:Carboxypeptidase regulatory-like domain
MMSGAEKESFMLRHIKGLVGLSIAVVVLVLISGGLAFGQTGTTAINGVVTDPQGNAVAGAAVTVTPVGTQSGRTVETDTSGHYQLQSLPPGTYTVKVEYQGFRTVVREKLELLVATDRKVDVRLELGEISQSVVVFETASTLNTQDATVGNAFDEKEVKSLPFLARNVVNLLTLQPGVVFTGNSDTDRLSQGDTSTQDGREGVVNGVRGNQTNVTLDGVDANDWQNQAAFTSALPVTLDSVQEFRVTTANANATDGVASGAQVALVTKSGTNEFHGNVRWYYRTSGATANSFFNKTTTPEVGRPKLQRNIGGGSIGGPIKKDRLFYLANYEGQVRNEPLTVNNSPALVGLSPTFFQDNPDIAAQVNATSGSFARSFNQNTAFGKVTGNINDKNSFAATYNFQRYRSPHGYFNTPTSSGDGLALTDGATSQFFQFSVQTTFSTASVNEFRFHFGSDYHFDLPPSPVTSPAVTIQNPDSGFVFGGARFQLATTDKRYQFVDTFTRIVGRHTAKFGVDININHDSDYFVYGPKGEYRFGGLSDVATGDFQLYLQSFGESTALFMAPTYAFFAQDQFRATHRLTLNYGLRYDLQVLPQPEPCNPDYAPTCHIPTARTCFHQDSDLRIPWIRRTPRLSAELSVFSTYKPICWMFPRRQSPMESAGNFLWSSALRSTMPTR